MHDEMCCLRFTLVFENRRYKSVNLPGERGSMANRLRYFVKNEK